MSSLIDKVDNQHQQPESTIMSALSSAYPSVNSRKLTDADEKIELIFYDFEKIMYFISFPCDDTNEGEKRRARTELSNTTTASSVSKKKTGIKKTSILTFFLRRFYSHLLQIYSAIPLMMLTAHLFLINLEVSYSVQIIITVSKKKNLRVKIRGRIINPVVVRLLFDKKYTLPKLEIKST